MPRAPKKKPASAAKGYKFAPDNKPCRYCGSWTSKSWDVEEQYTGNEHYSCHRCDPEELEERKNEKFRNRRSRCSHCGCPCRSGNTLVSDGGEWAIRKICSSCRFHLYKPYEQ